MSETQLDQNTDNDEIKVLCSLPKYIKSITKKTKLEFNYEVNLINYDALNKGKLVIDNKETSISSLIFEDSLLDLHHLINKKPFNLDIKQAVSKKKRRLDDKEYNLDMVHITKRMIAMGFPSKGCESIYRNSISEVIKLFKDKYNNKIKIYNLCIEGSRIYDKSMFQDSSVCLFPSKDHNPCSIKMILEFCIDSFLFRSNNKDSFIAVHCKAGKGRTGVMICSYMIFNGLVDTAEQAISYYDKARTYDGKGLTIASQKRYVKYFETFMRINYKRPYYNSLLSIIQENSIYQTKNILLNLMKDEKYFQYPSIFMLEAIEVGPFEVKNKLNIKIGSFVEDEVKAKIKSEWTLNEKGHYIKFIFLSKDLVNKDLLIKFEKSYSFYMWINLWFSTIQLLQEENCLQFSHQLNEKEKDKENDQNKEKTLYKTYKKVNYMGGVYSIPCNHTFNISFTAYEMDKFKNKHLMYPDFSVVVSYQVPE